MPFLYVISVICGAGIYIMFICQIENEHFGFLIESSLTLCNLQPTNSLNKHENNNCVMNLKGIIISSLFHWLWECFAHSISLDDYSSDSLFV